MSERIFLGAMGLVFGLGTFAALGLGSFMAITEVQQRLAQPRAQPPSGYVVVDRTAMR